MVLHRLEKPAVIEQLVIETQSEAVERWIELDHEIWTEGLASFEGFLRKEVWLSRDVPGRLTAVIYWSDYALWKAVDPEWLAEAERRFTERFAPYTMRIVAELHEHDQQLLAAEAVRN